MSDDLERAMDALFSGQAEAPGVSRWSVESPSAGPAPSDAELAALTGGGSNSDAWDDGLVFPDRPSSVCQSLDCESAAARMELAAAAAGPAEEFEISLEAPLEAQRLPERQLFPAQIDALLARLLGG